MPDISILQELYVAELKNLKRNQFFKPNLEIAGLEKQIEFLNAISREEKKVFREENSVPPHLGKEAKAIFRMKFEDRISGEKRKLEDGNKELHHELREDDKYVVDSKIEYLVSRSKLQQIERQLSEVGVKVYVVSGNKVVFTTEQGAILTEMGF